MKEMNFRALQCGCVLNNQYEIQSILGEGGFGITYLAKDLFLQIPVAVKEYFPGQLASRNTATGNNDIKVIAGESERYFKSGLMNYSQEANRLSKFSDLKGIVSVLNFFYENNTAYMVMEYIDGTDLGKYLKQNGGRLPWKQTLEMMQPVIYGLGKIHEAGIIHRDISPDNIMVTADGRMVIIDFGAAVNYDLVDAEKTVALKRGYAPLEQYDKRGNQGTWTDVYALCATIYRIMTGVRIPEALSIKNGNEKIRPIKDYVQGLPQRLEKTIMAGLQLQVKDRLQTIVELAQGLYGNSELQFERGKKNNRIYLFAGIGVMAALVVMAVISFLGLSNKSESLGSEVEVTNGVTDAAIMKTEETTDTMLSGQSDMQKQSREQGQPSESIQPTAKTELPIATKERLTYTVEDDGITIIGLDISMVEAEIPTDIDGLPVRKITSLSDNVIKLNLPEGLEILDQKVFRKAVYLKEIYIPSTLSGLTREMFENCLSLSKITVSQDSPYYYERDGVLYDADGSVIYSSK